MCQNVVGRLVCFTPKNHAFPAQNVVLLLVHTPARGLVTQEPNAFSTLILYLLVHEGRHTTFMLLATRRVLAGCCKSVAYDGTPRATHAAKVLFLRISIIAPKIPLMQDCTGVLFPLNCPVHQRLFLLSLKNQCICFRGQVERSYVALHLAGSHSPVF